MWQKIIDFLKSKGHVGEIVAKLLNKYKNKVGEMFEKILKNEAKELIKLIGEIKEDIIKIIKGGHIDVNFANDEEVVGNPIHDCEFSQFLSKVQKLNKCPPDVHLCVTVRHMSAKCPPI